MVDAAALPALLRLGTRGSALARWQTDHVAALLHAAWPDLHLAIEVLHTQGDKVLDTPLPLLGGKGLFTAELESALRSGSIDVAVHSLKDLPTVMAQGIVLGAIPPRADARDAVVSRSGCGLAALGAGATIGTSSRRRAAQIRFHYPHLEMIDIRGNVDTRIRKALDPDGPYDATILACAGIERLGRSDVICELLPLEVMLPAPGQGALGVQCRDEQALLARLGSLDDADTRAAVTAERAFLHGLGGGCSVPVAAYAQRLGNQLHVTGRVASTDGDRLIEVTVTGSLGDAEGLGAELARMALAQGAALLLGEPV